MKEEINIFGFIKRFVFPKRRNTVRQSVYLISGKTGGGNTSGFESLLYVNGKPYQGVDTNHGDVVFDDFSGLETELVFMLWSGLEDGGVNREMLELRRVMDELPGLPNVKTSFASDFFNKLHKAADEKKDRISEWDGELYLEYHRGIYTTQAANKRNNRKNEIKLFETEWLSVLSAMLGGKYPKDAIDDCWEKLLCLQFHDIIPGSSIREVYVDSDKTYAEKCKNPEFLGCEVIENGEIMLTIRSRYKYNKSLITQDTILYSSLRRIDFKTKVNWHEKQRLLKTAFEVDVRSTKATYDKPMQRIKGINYFLIYTKKICGKYPFIKEKYQYTILTSALHI